MSLLDYNWDQQDLSTTRYAGKYVSHDWINKRNIVEQVEDPENDLELGEQTLTYDGEKMDVRLDVNENWVAFFYDETFEEELGDEDIYDVFTYFLTPDRWKHAADLEEK
jgi:hypothetical protein